MEKIFEQVWEEVQDRVEASIRLNFLSKNIISTDEQIEDEMDKRMIILVEKLCDLAFQGD